MRYRSSYSSGMSGMDNKVKIIGGAGVLGLVGIISCAPHCSRGEYVATVTDKERITETSTDSEGRTRVSSKYLVFTELDNNEVRVFQNTDSLIEWKWDSSNMQARLKKGERFKIETYGWRVPFLSMYENIVGATKMPHRTQDRGANR